MYLKIDISYAGDVRFIPVCFSINCNRYCQKVKSRSKVAVETVESLEARRTAAIRIKTVFMVYVVVVI